MAVPTVEQIREWSKQDFAGLGYSDDDDLQVLIDRASADLQRITGRTWEGLITSTTLQPIAEQALQGMVEAMAYRNSEDYLETLGDFDLISSFSVGGYSEQRRSPEEAKKARLLHSWPWVSELLYGLLTDEQRDFWDAFFGDTVPAFEVTEVDWSERLGPYDDYDSLLYGP